MVSKITILIVAVLFIFSNTYAQEHRLTEGFRNPGKEYRPRAYWDWLNGDVSLPGLTRDLEEAKAKELGGLLMWDTPPSIEKLTSAGKPGLPDGIEVQILDHGFTDLMKEKGAKTDWFGTNGDVFPVRVKMTLFPPLSPDGSRSFPRKNLARGHGEWNHYYIRAINGEVRLWVNGEEVSDGTSVEPRKGYLCLESEGSPIQFRKLRVRELP
jgi:hypothetical protein